MDRDTIARSATTGVAPPPGAPEETSQPLTSTAGQMNRPKPGEPGYETYIQLQERAGARQDEIAASNAELAASALPAAHAGAPVDHTGDGPARGGVAEAVEAARVGKLDPFYENLAAERVKTVAPPPISLDAAPAAHTTSKRISRKSRLPMPMPGGADQPTAGDNHDAQLSADQSGHRVPAGALPADRLDTVVEAPRQVVQPAGTTGPEGDGTAPPVQYVGTVASRPAPAGPIDLTQGLPPAVAPQAAHQPAASDTDSPTRGVPRGPGADKITGGFADQAALQYFALDGHELGVLVQDMLVELHERVERDLRFNEAITYPRVSVKCSIEVTGFMYDDTHVIDKVMLDANASQGAPTTPIELARQIADEIVFVLVAAKSETDASGNAVDPPDKIRVELNLRRPRKQVVIGAGGTRQMVDVVG